jgi:hypothetical protein
MNQPVELALIGLAVAIVNGYFGLKLAKMSHVIDATHRLVNSEHGVALDSNKVLANKVAELTGTPHDIAVAQDATKRADAHDEASAKMGIGGNLGGAGI